MAGKPSVAAELLERMRAAGCPPNVVAYTSLLSAYGAAGDAAAAEDVLRRMQAAGCPPNSRTYTELMSHLLALGGWCWGFWREGLWPPPSEASTQPLMRLVPFRPPQQVSGLF